MTYLENANTSVLMNEEYVINSTINGEGDGQYLLDVLVIVNRAYQLASDTEAKVDKDCSH